uniref:Disintegrin domain-containing protein n=1 Tax=Emiliania huxleyi TaxID=2903 RepID=A0A7S3X0V2_EMIHU
MRAIALLVVQILRAAAICLSRDQTGGATTCTQAECSSSCQYICAGECCSHNVNNCMATTRIGNPDEPARQCSATDGCPKGRSCCTWDNVAGANKPTGLCAEVCLMNADALPTPEPTPPSPMPAAHEVAGCPGNPSGRGSNSGGCCLGEGSDWCSEHYQEGFVCVNNACGLDDCCVPTRESCTFYPWVTDPANCHEDNCERYKDHVCDGGACQGAAQALNRDTNGWCDSSSNAGTIAAIVGGCVGGALFLAIPATAIVIHKQHAKRMSTEPPPPHVTAAAVPVPVGSATVVPRGIVQGSELPVVRATEVMVM